MNFTILVSLLSALAGAPSSQVTISEGPDILIHSGTIVATAADYEMDGTMWVAFTVLEDSTTYVYKSLGHGTTWECRFTLRRSGDLFDRLQLVVGEGDSGFVHLFHLINSQGGDLWQVRYREGGSPVGSPVLAGPDTIRDFAVCRDYTGSNYWLYAVVTNPESQIPFRALRFLRSSTYGRDWYATDSFSVGVYQPHLSAGQGSHIYFTYHSNWLGGAVHMWTNRLYLNPSMWVHGLVTTDSEEVADPVVAPAFTLPESTSTVWCLWSQNYLNSGDWDIKYSFATDGGRTWSAPAFLAGSATYDERFPDLRNYTSPGNQYVNASYIVDDDVLRRVHRRYAHAASPGGWSDTLRINEGSAGTGPQVRPKLCYSPGGPFTGAGCVFVGTGLNGCWWNAPYPGGIAGEKSISRPAPALLVEPTVGRAPFCILAEDRVSVSIHDRAGRVVRTLRPERGRAVWDGTDDEGRAVASGVYFIKFTAGEHRATEKLVLQR